MEDEYASCKCKMKALTERKCIILLAGRDDGEYSTVVVRLE